MKLIKKATALAITASLAATSTVFSGITASAAEKAPYKVLIINFDPVFDVNGKQVKQHDLMEAIDVKEKFFRKWNDPYDLAEQFADAMEEISYGNVSYTIAETIELNEFPEDKDGNSYTAEEYYDTLIEACNATGGRYWSYEGWRDTGFSFNYEKYFEEGNPIVSGLTDFNSSNTRLLDIEEVKAKLLSLPYIQEELKQCGF